MIDFPALEDQIVIALRRITRASELRSQVLLQIHGLTGPQLAVLRAIQQQSESASHSGSVTPGEIARIIHLGQPTVTGILERLSQRGLIERTRREQDKRSLNISLSEAGWKLLETAPSPLQESFRAELLKLREWERTQVLSTMQRIADMMHPIPGANETLPKDLPSVDKPVATDESAASVSTESPWTEVPQTLL